MFHFPAKNLDQKIKYYLGRKKLILKLVPCQQEIIGKVTGIVHFKEVKDWEVKEKDGYQQQQSYRTASLPLLQWETDKSLICL